MRIPLVRPVMPKWEDIGYHFKSCYFTGVFSNFGALFEAASDRLSEMTGRHCLPVSTGTSAIEIACRLKFRPGERVLVPDYTHIGTVQAVRAAGCVPVFGSVGHDWVLSTRLPEPVTGMIVVSPFGYPVDVRRLDRFAQEQGIGIVYDFAGAWGMFPGTINPICYSLHATKNFSCGEGGVLSLASRAEWERARWYSNFCNDSDRQVRTLDGANHKPSEMLCAIILAHMDSYSVIYDRINRKMETMLFYKENLPLYCPEVKGGSPSLCVFEGITKPIADRLVRQGIEVRQYYPPFTHELCFHQENRSGIVSRYAMPSDVTREEAEEVVESVKRAIKC